MRSSANNERTKICAFFHSCEVAETGGDSRVNGCGQFVDEPIVIVRDFRFLAG